MSALPEPVQSDAPPRSSVDVPDIDPLKMGAWYQLCRSLARLAIVMLFDFKAYGLHNVPRRGGVLLCANHQSYLDPMLFGAVIPRPVSFLAKSELFTNRYFGWLIRSLHAFPVRQGRGDKAAIDETIRRLREGHLLNLYPEGSRSEDGEIAPIQRGAALVVRRAGVPILPAVVHGSFDAWPKERKLFRPHPVRVLYGPPLNVDGLKSEQIVDLLDRTLRKMLNDLRAGRIAEYQHGQH